MRERNPESEEITTFKKKLKGFLNPSVHDTLTAPDTLGFRDFSLLLQEQGLYVDAEPDILNSECVGGYTLWKLEVYNTNTRGFYVEKSSKQIRDSQCQPTGKTTISIVLHHLEGRALRNQFKKWQRN